MSHSNSKKTKRAWRPKLQHGDVVIRKKVATKDHVCQEGCIIPKGEKYWRVTRYHDKKAYVTRFCGNECFGLCEDFEEKGLC